jgi:type I restriction enzyme S subunit
MAAVASGANILHIGVDALGALPVRVPPLHEQRRIADFLDEQVARLDELKVQTRKARACVRQRGDVTVQSLLLAGGRILASPPWITGTPADWQVVPLRALWSVIDCKHRTPPYEPDGVPVVSPGDVSPGRLELSRATRFVSVEDYRDLADDLRRCRVGDIVYSRNASAGTAAYVDNDRPFAMGQDVCRLTSRGQDQLYLAYVLNHLMAPQLEAARLGSTITRINVDAIKNLRVPAPPVETQRALALDCDRALDSWNRVEGEVQRLSDLVEERRRALITACVNGDFDVSAAKGRAGDAALAHPSPTGRVLAE